MNAHLILFFFFLSSLMQDALTQLVFTGPEGGSITVRCSFTFSGGTRRFCRKSCEDGDVLIETEDIRAQRGRYSIEYEEGAFPVFYSLVHVTINQLRKSDSGQYMCGLRRFFLRPESNERVEIIVTDASPSSTPSWSVEPSPTSFPAATAPTSSSPQTSEQPQSSAPQITALLLNVSFIFIIIITLSVTVMVFCRIRTSKHTVAG